MREYEVRDSVRRRAKEKNVCLREAWGELPYRENEGSIRNKENVALRQ